jgi:uncharacterized membrane protein YciS (DUF1049 family)
MLWRLIAFILVFAVFLTFITLNLGNEYQCDINFGFTKIQNVPVFLTIFVSFALGLICALPLFMHLRKSRKDKLIKEIKSKPYKINEHEQDPAAETSSESVDPKTARKKFLEKKRGKNET